MKSKRLLYSIFTIVLTMVLFILPVSAQEVPENLQEAAATLREGIKNWENLVTVTFLTDLDSFDGTTASANALAERVLDLALAHTGVPDEGDYLRFNIGHMEPSSVNFTQQNDGWQFSFTYYFAYWTTPEQEAEVDREIDRLVTTLNLKSDLTEYQKIATIYQYITGNIVYDYEHLEDDAYGLKFTTYAAAVNKTAVCQGYSTLFYRLALEAGLDNRIITGYAQGEDHSWNIVKLDGVYYNLDATWDAGVFDYRYFLQSATDFQFRDYDPEYETEEFLAKYPVAETAYDLPDIENVCEGDFQYRIVNGKAVLIRYAGSGPHATVPTATQDGYPVHTIDTYAFRDCWHLTSITFSEGIKYINPEAIFDCPNLKEIHLPSTIDFTGSKDPDFQCRIVCGPWNCPSMETITVAEDNPNLVVVDNVLYTKDMTILRYYPSGDTREVFEIPEGVLAISAYAFAYNTHLKEVKMCDTVRRLQIGSFDSCTQLETINISNSCNFIDQYVFSKTALESIHIPASVEMLFSGSFGIESKVKYITVDPANPYYYVMDNVLYGHYTEENAPLTCGVTDWEDVVLGDFLVRYPAGMDAMSFTVPEGIVGIEQEAFSHCTNLQEVILPDSLQVISSGAFYYCTELLRINLPENLKEIHSQPFWGCSSLVELVIPASVEYLEYYLVGQGDSYSLENVRFLGDMPEMSDQTFFNCPVDIYYPAGNTTWEEALQMYSGNADARWHEECSTHQFETVTMDPLCLAVGYTGQVCSVCGLVKDTGDYGPAIGHDLIIDPVYPPDCEEQIIAFYLCRRCNGTVEYIIEPIGHTYDENGICKNCVANDAKTSTPEYEDVMLEESKVLLISVCTGLGILAVIGIIVLICKAFRKPRAK